MLILTHAQSEPSYQRANVHSRGLGVSLALLSEGLQNVMRNAPSIQALGALIAESRMAQSLPHSAAVHAARESI